MVLKADDVIGVRPLIFLAQLNYGVGLLSSARVCQSYRLHRTKAQSIAAPAGNFLDRQAGFEIVEVFPIAFLGRLCTD